MRGQTKQDSIIEAMVNTFVGFAVAIIAQGYLFPGLTAYDSFRIAAIFTAISILRSYVMRRLFNRWYVYKATCRPCEHWYTPSRRQS